MEPSSGKLLLRALLLTGNATCGAYHSCGSCVDHAGCYWCSTGGDCFDAQDDDSCPDGKSDSCSSPEYIVIIFIVILVVLVCLCFGTCYWRKFRGFDEDMLAPLLPQQARYVV
jgi:hypothetical protein